eukprot:c6582_g1_i3.p1 GENE.c6582_g1_i3~~c6582_g1_i3.p1  ORF type:complete len:129 (-),score=23.83 c6582_g1_i3:70-456(-)
MLKKTPQLSKSNLSKACRWQTTRLVSPQTSRQASDKPELVLVEQSRKRKAPAFGEPAEPKPVSRKSNKKSQQRLSPPPVNSKLHQLDEQGFAERVKGPLPATSPTKDLDDAHNKTAVNSGILRWCKQP